MGDCARLKPLLELLEQGEKSFPCSPRTPRRGEGLLRTMGRQAEVLGMSFPELTAPRGEPCPAPQHPNSETQVPPTAASSAQLQGHATDPNRSLLCRA